ncbi:unnamed protein product [Symbiodinium microadriaticum]|nr:unnamed protein product [Symbiodinium microadriaticum]
MLSCQSDTVRNAYENGREVETLNRMRQLDLGQPAAVDSQLRETAATGIERAVACVRHIHSHAERERDFPKVAPTCARGENFAHGCGGRGIAGLASYGCSIALPMGMIMAVVVDSGVDGYSFACSLTKSLRRLWVAAMILAAEGSDFDDGDDDDDGDGDGWFLSAANLVLTQKSERAQAVLFLVLDELLLEAHEKEESEAWETTPVTCLKPEWFRVSKMAPVLSARSLVRSLGVHGKAAVHLSWMPRRICFLATLARAAELSPAESLLCQSLHLGFERWTQAAGRISEPRPWFHRATPRQHCQDVDDTVNHAFFEATSVSEFLHDLESSAGYGGYGLLSEGRQLQADLSSLVEELRPASTVSHVKLADLPAKVMLQFDSPSLGSGSIAIKSDVQEYRGDMNCPDSISAIRTVENWYLPHGFEVIYPLSTPPISRESLRKLRVLPWAPRLVGCQPRLWYRSLRPKEAPAPSSHQEVCKCLVSARNRTNVFSGAGIADSDVELFVRLRTLAFLTKGGGSVSVHAFVVGNSFGFSALLLGLLFAKSGSGSVDVLDEEPDACTRTGGWLTRQIARTQNLNVSLTRGTSPKDVPKATRTRTYDLAFIDGGHSTSQLQQDFEAVRPFLAQRTLVVLHDVVLYGMYDFVLGYFKEPWRIHLVRGCAYKNICGTVLLHRDFPEDAFESL